MEKYFGLDDKNLNKVDVAFNEAENQIFSPPAKQIDLNEIIKNKDLGYVTFVYEEDEIDRYSKEELLNRIKDKNPEMQCDLTVADFECKKNFEQRTITITGCDKYFGIVTLKFNLEGINVTTIIKETNLGTIIWPVARGFPRPTIRYLLSAIKAKNPEAEYLTTADLAVVQGGLSQALIVGCGEHTGQVVVTFETVQEKTIQER